MTEVGRIFTPYGTKFGVPKQGGMVCKDNSEIVLSSEYSKDSVRGLEIGAFIWVLWRFHECGNKQKELIRPPKLGGNEKMGVFGSRSPFRPNNIAMSLLRLESVNWVNSRVRLIVQGADMVNNTPILDIKPYHPKADVPWAQYPTPWFLEEDNVVKEVLFSCEVDNTLKEVVREVLGLDPRPAYHDDSERIYVNSLKGMDIYWKAQNDKINVIEIKKGKK